MRLTKQTNYAIRILMYCAANHGKLSRIGDIAKVYGVSELFLFKILKSLVSAGFVETVRGRSGGIKLALPAENITLLQAVKTTEEGFDMAECFNNETAVCPLLQHCELSSALHEALNAFFSVLNTYTIADMVKPDKRISALLGIDDIIHNKQPSTVT